MKCVLCGGALQEKVVEEEVRVGSDHFLVNMKVQVCSDCNERYYQEGQVDKLIELKKRLSKEKKQYQSVGKVYLIP